MPAAIDFDRYRATAWMAVGSRLAGVIFFVGFQAASTTCSATSISSFFVPEAILLTMALATTMRGRCSEAHAIEPRLLTRAIAAGPRRVAVRLQPFLPRASRRRSFASDEDHFLFGSIGTEETDGVPYWIWLVLPRMFPEYLPRARRLRVARPAREGRPRDADRALEGDDRLRARRHQLRDVPHGQLPRARRRSADDRARPDRRIRWRRSCTCDS